jgi:hypothetical protein
MLHVPCYRFSALLVIGFLLTYSVHFFCESRTGRGLGASGWADALTARTTRDELREHASIAVNVGKEISLRKSGTDRGAQQKNDDSAKRAEQIVSFNGTLFHFDALSPN